MHVKRHVTNFVDNNIPVIKMFNFELFTININQILLINDLSFPT